MENIKLFATSQAHEQLLNPDKKEAAKEVLQKLQAQIDEAEKRDTGFHSRSSSLGFSAHWELSENAYQDLQEHIENHKKENPHQTISYYGWLKPSEPSIILIYHSKFPEALRHVGNVQIFWDEISKAILVDLEQLRATVFS